MKIVAEAKSCLNVTYSLEFCFTSDPNSGFAFDCDKDGNVFKENPNYLACLTGKVNGLDVIREGVKCYKFRYTKPAVGKCSCGRKVELDSGWENKCEKCGRLYNGSGQELDPDWERKYAEEYNEFYAY